MIQTIESVWLCKEMTLHCFHYTSDILVGVYHFYLSVRSYGHTMYLHFLVHLSVQQSQNFCITVVLEVII